MLGVRPELLRIQNSETMWAVTVFGIHLILINDEFSYIMRKVRTLFKEKTEEISSFDIIAAAILTYFD